MIEVCGLVKRYGEKTALDGIGFSVKSGEVVGLLGLNGAGKSTTMNIMTGYISATAGTVSLDGFDIIREPLKAKAVTGYLPEQLAFYPDMRVYEYLEFISDLKGYAKKRSLRGPHLADICEKVGISAISGRMIRNLSKGYRQRVSFAQALIGNPKVLILDEPTAGLDPSQIREIRKLIRDQGKTSTVIVSSHILSEIQEICSRVIILHKGRILADGAPVALAGLRQSYDRMTVRVQGGEDDVRNALTSVPGVTDVFLLPRREEGTCDFQITGDSSRDIRADVFRVLAKADLPLLQSSGSVQTLEDIFLNLVSVGETGGGQA